MNSMMAALSLPELYHCSALASPPATVLLPEFSVAETRRRVDPGGWQEEALKTELAEIVPPVGDEADLFSADDIQCREEDGENGDAYTDVLSSGECSDDYQRGSWIEQFCTELKPTSCKCSLCGQSFKVGNSFKGKPY